MAAVLSFSSASLAFNPIQSERSLATTPHLVSLPCATLPDSAQRAPTDSRSLTFAAIATPIAQASIVGIDQRALASSLSPIQSVLSSAHKTITRASQLIVMAAPDVSPKVVGDYDFDPLGLGSPENFAFMREAEIKHGRLAMLSAVAWPLQEIFHPILAGSLRAPDMLAVSGGASPSVLNGGLGQDALFPSLLAFTIGAALLDETDLKQRRALGCAWNEYPNSYGAFGRLPGNYNFDPLNFYRPLSDAAKVSVQERELLNGRLAMLAVAAYVAVEFFGQTTIVRTASEDAQPPRRPHLASPPLAGTHSHALRFHPHARPRLSRPWPPPARPDPHLTSRPSGARHAGALRADHPRPELPQFHGRVLLDGLDGR